MGISHGNELDLVLMAQPLSSSFFMYYNLDFYDLAWY